jgi:hypothetical protein
MVSYDPDGSVIEKEFGLPVRIINGETKLRVGGFDTRCELRRKNAEGHPERVPPKGRVWRSHTLAIRRRDWSHNRRGKSRNPLWTVVEPGC